jgi:hypothetical protein
VGIGHRVAELWGFCGGFGRPGMEHHAPQLLELMTNFRVTQRHRRGLPGQGNSAPNAEYLLSTAALADCVSGVHIFRFCT